MTKIGELFKAGSGIHTAPKCYILLTIDYGTIKYDIKGNQLWVVFYNGPGNNDVSDAIAVEASGNIYVTGKSDRDDFWDDYATIKYDTNGNQLWVRSVPQKILPWCEENQPGITTANSVLPVSIGVLKKQSSTEKNVSI